MKGCQGKHSLQRSEGQTEVLDSPYGTPTRWMQQATHRRRLTWKVTAYLCFMVH